MWHPPPVLVPVYLEPNARRMANVPSAAMWPVIPFEQQLCFVVNDMVDYRESVEDTRKLLLSKSLYELVKVNHFLELTNPKLLGWYLSLPAEGINLIQEEGGLLQFMHRHPALEVSRHIVHLKIPDMSSNLNRSTRAPIYGVSQCVNCSMSCPSGVKKCRRCSTLILTPEENVCLHEEEKTLHLLPNNVRAELNLLKDTGHVSEDMEMSSHQFNCIQRTSTCLSATQSNTLNSFQQTEQPRNNSIDGQHLCQMWEERVQCDGRDFRVFEDPLAQANILLDMEPEMHSHCPSSPDHDQMALLSDPVLDFSNLEEETLPENYSFNSTTVEHTSAQWSDVTSTSMMATKGSTEASTNDEPENYTFQRTENCTFPDSASFLSNSSDWTDLTGDCQNVSSDDDQNCGTKADEYHGVNEEDSITACINHSWPASGQCTRDSEFTCGGCISSTSLSELNVKTTTMCKVSPVPFSVSQTVDASSDFRASFTSTQTTEVTQDFFLKHCHDVSTGTDMCPVNQETQTIQRPTSEKCILTEVYMSDLDALCEEFGKLRMMEEELMLLKEQMLSAGGFSSKQNSCGCGAVSRARWAELRLLTLQFAMCQQHCWRRFYTSLEGETSFQGIDAVPDAMSQTLKSLEDNYLKMKMKILEGVPLDKLKPLSVDTKRLTATTCYRPSLIYETFIGDGLTESSFRPSSLNEGQANQTVEVLKITDHGHLNKNTTALQCNSATSSETVSSMRSRVVPGSSQQPGASSDAKPDAPKDLNSSDAWYDAEEELVCDDTQTGLGDQGESKKEQAGVDPNRKVEPCFSLCVSNLPNTITEHDLLLWFAKYHTNQVSISSFTNPRVAIVSVRNTDDAEAAIREMNGRSVQGHALHVEHHHKPPTDGQVTIKEFGVQLSPATHKAGSAGEELILLSSNNFQASSSLRCSLEKLTNISTTPTASGTCVPQHYGTMGSFDTIMAQLSERHPKMDRQQIVSALLELQTKHHGVLSGLPLGEIVDMTSELIYSTTD